MGRTWWLVVGIISILGGILALINPFGATLLVEQLVGWGFILVGVLQILVMFLVSSTQAKVLAAVGGLIGVLIGYEILQQPLKGAMAMTVVIAVLFLLTGLLRSLVAFGLRHSKMFFPMLISALVPIVFAVIIFLGYPQSASYVLGILLAAELIANGISLSLFSRLLPAS